MFPVHDIQNFLRYKAESLGTKEKVWVQPPEDYPLPQRPHLFKIGRPGTGENWAEVVAFAIAQKLGLPCATYHFARSQDQIGVISEQFYPDDARFIHGNIFLSKIIRSYDGEKKFHQVDYDLNKILNLVLRVASSPPLNCEHENSLKVFIGYLILDVLIGNTDRHHENWGIVVEPEKKRVTLAPTFDHASSLGRNETEERRLQRLETKDHRATVEAYAARARSAFFDRENRERTLTLAEMLEKLVASHPIYTRYWAELAVGIETDFFEDVFEQIEPDCIAPNAAPFALRMLRANQNLLSEVALV